MIAGYGDVKRHCCAELNPPKRNCPPLGILEHHRQISPVPQTAWPDTARDHRYNDDHLAAMSSWWTRNGNAAYQSDLSLAWSRRCEWLQGNQDLYRITRQVIQETSLHLLEIFECHVRKTCEEMRRFLRLDSTSTSRAWRLACINATSAKDSAATSATWPSRFKSICNSYRKSSGWVIFWW